MRLFNLIKRTIGKVVREVRCAQLNRLIDEGGGHFELPNPWMSISIRKATGARLIVRGRIVIQPWLESDAKTVFDLAQGSSLEFAGDFIIGPGVKIVVGHLATLRFGGRQKESGSGITCDTTILVNHRINIGADFICAWGVFITDCDWHDYNGQACQADVTIGDQVWVAHQSSILKGVVIPDGCVIAAHSLVLGGKFLANSLIAGCPASSKRNNILWHRDMSKTK